MSTVNQLPRSTRRIDYVAADGQTVFGPTAWLCFDPLDVGVRTRVAGGKWTTLTSGFTVTLTTPALGFPTVTFDAGLAAGVKVRLEGDRVHPRLTDVTRAGALITAALERELDTQSAVLQELRRDASEARERALFVEEGQAAPILDVDALKGKALGLNLAGEFAGLPPGLGTLLADSILDAGAAGKDLLRATTVAALIALLPSFVGSGPAHARGLVPDPGAVAGAARFLNEDGTWKQVVAGGYEARAAAAAASIPASIKVIDVGGLAALDDGGAGRYVRLAAPPAPVKAWHFQSADGGWWELREFAVCPKMLGAQLNGVADDRVALQAWVDYSAAFACVARGNPGSTPIASGSINVPQGARIQCRNEMTLIRATDVVEPLILASALTNPHIEGLRFQYTAGVTSTSNYSMISSGPLTFGGVAANGFVVNQFVIIRPTIQQQKYMIARVVSYGAGLLSVDVTSSDGSGGGPYNNWFIQSYTDSTGGGFSPAAIRAEGCTYPTIVNNEVAGRFFIGIGLKNTVKGGKVLANRIIGVSDRGVENDQTTTVCKGVEIAGNYIEGQGWTFYGVNSAAFSGGQHIGLNVHDNDVIGCLSHGVSASGAIFRGSISRNTIEMFTFGASAYGIGIFLQNLTTNYPTGMSIGDNSVVGGLHNVYLLHAFAYKVHDNQLELAGAAGIHAQTINVAAGTGGGITGNTVSNAIGSGIYVNAAVGFGIFGLAIGSNRTNNCGGWGILTTTPTTGFSITGNVSLNDTAGKISSAGTSHVAAGNA